MLFKSLCIAFKTYSRIPMPEVEWNEKNMKYAVCFFPLIGAVIGAFEFLWRFLAGILSVNTILYGAIAALLPILITGAIHMDGFCDTVDALSSHQTKERMLEILKDSHAGAFAIIFGTAWMIVYFACFTQIADYKSLWVIGFGFILSRSLSGLALVIFKNARKNGMLHAFSDTAGQRPVLFSMAAGIGISAILMILLGGWRGVIAVVVNGLVFLYYRILSYKKFGGITGDLAGCFLQLAELATAVVMALTAGL